MASVIDHLLPGFAERQRVTSYGDVDRTACCGLTTLHALGAEPCGVVPRHWPEGGRTPLRVQPVGCPVVQAP